MIKTTKKRQAPPTVSTTAKQAKMGEVPSNWYLCENWQKYSDAISRWPSARRPVQTFWRLS